jgi:hypothetical protein
MREGARMTQAAFARLHDVSTGTLSGQLTLRRQMDSIKRKGIEAGL